MPVWLVICASLLYVAGLFALAWRRDRRARKAGFTQHPAIYPLALGVYCTSWTYFGAVGTAAARGWEYLPIFLGPILTYLLAWRVVARVARVSKREGVTSLSDFLAARFGKHRRVGALAAITALMGSLPYIALQLQSMGQSFAQLTAADPLVVSGASDGVVTALAIVLAAFAILFGARSADTTASNAGLMRVLAFESMLKLAALAAVCVLALTLLSVSGDPTPSLSSAAARALTELPQPSRFLSILVLSMLAVLCLPRQFHIANIERQSDRELKLARWVFPGYLLVTSIVVLPIALAGSAQFDATVAADVYVLALPLSQGDGLLALLVFLGGFSASMGMVIVATIALSTMITNDLVVPVLLRYERFRDTHRAAGRLLLTRRVSCCLVLAAAWGFYLVAGGSRTLADIGLLSFAAAAQFGPALLAALFWRGAHWRGACLGMLAGMAIWAHTLLLPSVLGTAYTDDLFPSLLSPLALFGVDVGDPLTHGVVMSLAINTLLFVVGSLGAPKSLIDDVQAVAFAANGAAGAVGNLSADQARVRLTDLKALAARFLDRAAVDTSFERYFATRAEALGDDEDADAELVGYTEKLLATALGAPSARLVMSSALRGSAEDLGDVLSVVSARDRSQLFNQHMLQSMLENIDQGISVVDNEQRLVAWNEQYGSLFDYPPRLLQIGQPITDLIEYNTRTGWLEPQSAEAQARRRVDHMRAGTTHSYERRSPQGRWLRISGHPMPGGGYVTTFTDITEDKAREQALIEANEQLEARVQERTAELEGLAEKLEIARTEADRANASKTRFLAAASHDLLQPLNAARLFVGAVSGTQLSDPDREALDKADNAIRSADNLLSGLLDITRLDHRAPPSQIDAFPIGPMLEELAEEAEPMAARAGLDVRLVPSSLMVRADPNYLQSIVRNFISNAHRYTRSGGLVIGARRVGQQVRIEVWDTGPGIPSDQLDRLFDEFARLEDVDNQGLRGAGLGLAVVRRLARLTNAEISVRSRPGKGSVFRVAVERVEKQHPAGPPRRIEKLQQTNEQALVGMRCLCIDDEETVLDGLRMLLESWQCEVRTAANLDEAARQLTRWPAEAVIADLQLRDGESGFEFLKHQGVACPDLVRVLITARSGPDIERLCAAEGVALFRKPMRAKDLLSTLTAGRSAESARHRSHR